MKYDRGVKKGAILEFTALDVHIDVFMKFSECFRRAPQLLTSENNFIILQKKFIKNYSKSF